MELVISRELLDVVLAHCRDEWPYEACGLLAVSGERVLAVWPGTNALHSSSAYRLADEEVARWMWEIEETRGQEAATYHSHPHGPDHLSPTDLAQVGCPLNLLVWFAGRDDPQVRAFRVNASGVVSEVRLTVEDEGRNPLPGAGL